MGLFDSLAAPAPQSLDPNNPQTVLSPDAVKRRQMLADALMKEGSDASPVRSGWQAAARVAQGLLSGYYSGQADNLDAAGAAQRDRQTAAITAIALGNDNSATPAAPAAVAGAPSADGSAPVAPGSAGTAAPGSPAVLSAIQTAANENGIPLPVAHAMATQESRLNPNAPTGGLFQITQGTAADPGYGLAPFDMSKVNDPLANARFGMKYLAARNPGINWNDPSQLTAALNSYNGGGDPNYVEHVLAHYDPKGVAALYGGGAPAGGPQVASAPLAAPARVAAAPTAPAPLPPIQTDGFSPPALGATMPPALATAAPAAAGGGWSPPGEIAPAVAAQQAAQRAALAASLRAPGAWTPPAEIGGAVAAQAASPAPGPQAFAGAGVGALPPSMTAPPQAPPVAVAAAPAPVIAQGDEGDDAPTNPVPVGAGLNIPASAGVPVPGATSQPVAVPAVAPAAPAPNAPALAAALRSPKDRAQIAALAGAMQDPWASEGTKQLASTLLAAKLKGATTGPIVKDPTTGQFGQYDSAGKFTPIANADKETQTAEQKNFEYAPTHPGFAEYQKSHGAESTKSHVLGPNGVLVDNSGKELYKAPPAAGGTPPQVDENGNPVYSQSEKVIGNLMRQGLPIPPGLARAPGGSALIKRGLDYAASVGNADPALEAQSRGAAHANQKGAESEQEKLGGNNASMGQAAVEAGQAFDLAQTASDNMPRGDWVPLNKVKQFWQGQTSDPLLGKLQAANLTASNLAARAISPTGVGTDESREHFRDLLNEASGSNSYNAKLAQMRAEVNLAKTSPLIAMEMLRQHRLEAFQKAQDATAASRGDSATPAAPAAPSGPAHYNFDAKGNLIQ
jgi:hypothetical protein